LAKPEHGLATAFQPLGRPLWRCYLLGTNGYAAFIDSFLSNVMNENRAFYRKA
jgi:hypothetical protein